jgi:hypothetical protein
LIWFDEVGVEVVGAEVIELTECPGKIPLAIALEKSNALEDGAAWGSVCPATRSVGVGAPCESRLGVGLGWLGLRRVSPPEGIGLPEVDEGREVDTSFCDESADESNDANPVVSSPEEGRDETKPRCAVVSTEIGERSTART